MRDISIFWALPGAHALGRVHSPSQDNITWLVETEIAFSVEEQYFIGTTAGKFTSKVHALFPEMFAQNLEYLAALWSDLDEKLSSWS